MIMFLFLFALWLVLNGRITLEICLFGLVIAGGVYAFCVKALGYHPRHERVYLRRAWLLVVYVFALIWEIFKANLSVMRIILTPQPEYEAAIVRLKVPLKNAFSRVLLANSITLTPGTVTVAERDGTFLVLCLEKEGGLAIPEWRLTRMLERWEGETWN
jgi:multicomponent Na+:H+ antiporter subunit E